MAAPLASHQSLARAERLFGAASMGRLTLARNGMKLCALDAEYDPRADTVLKAFVRLCAVRAQNA